MLRLFVGGICGNIADIGNGRCRFRFFVFKFCRADCFVFGKCGIFVCHLHAQKTADTCNRQRNTPLGGGNVIKENERIAERGNTRNRPDAELLCGAVRNDDCTDDLQKPERNFCPQQFCFRSERAVELEHIQHAVADGHHIGDGGIEQSAAEIHRERDRIDSAYCKKHNEQSRTECCQNPNNDRDNFVPASRAVQKQYKRDHRQKQQLRCCKAKGVICEQIQTDKQEIRGNQTQKQSDRRHPIGHRLKTRMQMAQIPLFGIALFRTAVGLGLLLRYRGSLRCLWRIFGVFGHGLIPHFI